MIASLPAGRSEVARVALVTPEECSSRGELPKGRSSAKKVTEPVGPAPEVAVTTAVSWTGCPKSEPAGAELVTLVAVPVAGAPPTSPS